MDKLLEAQEWIAGDFYSRDDLKGSPKRERVKRYAWPRSCVAFPLYIEHRSDFYNTLPPGYINRN